VRFVVYGAGAVGGVIGAHLFQNGHDVTLIARGAHHDAIREHGLRLDTPDESVTLPIPVAARPAEVKFSDVVLLAMKTQDTAPALAELSAAAPPGIVVASAQNGVENERMALRLFPEVYGVCVLLPRPSSSPASSRCTWRRSAACWTSAAIRAARTTRRTPWPRPSATRRSRRRYARTSCATSTASC
jgi:2-dehydropantoate 2-reductase